MNPKNTIKFIAILVAVGFFGSILIGGPSTGNLAQLSAPSLSASALLSQTGARTSVMGSSSVTPAVFPTVNDVHFEFRLPEGATKMSVTVYGGVGINTLRIIPTVVSPIFNLRDLPSSIVNSIVPNQTYELRAISCDDNDRCSAAHSSFFFTVESGIVPTVTEEPVLPTIVLPDFIVTARCSVPPTGTVPGQTVTDGIVSGRTINTQLTTEQRVPPSEGDCIYKYDRAAQSWIIISGAAPVVPTTPIVPPADQGIIAGIISAIQNAFISIREAATNAINWIVGVITGKNPPSTLGVHDNLEIVKAPELGSLIVNVSASHAPSTAPDGHTIPNPSITCGSTCTGEYQFSEIVNQTPNRNIVTVTVSNANPANGGYKFTFYKTDGFGNGTHQPGNGIAPQTFPIQPANCPPSSSCVFDMLNMAFIPEGGIELWIEPLTCGNNIGSQFNFAIPTATIIPPPAASPNGQASLSTTVSPKSAIPANISYDAQLGWGPNYGNSTLKLISPVVHFDSTNSSPQLLTGTVAGDSVTPVQTTSPVSSFFAAVKFQETLSIPGFSPIVTNCGYGLSTNDPAFPNNTDMPIKPSGSTPPPVTASITVQKKTIDQSGAVIQDAQDFNFSLTGSSYSNSTTLDTDGASSTPLFYTFPAVTVSPSTLIYTLTETVPAGWETTNVSCTSTNGPVTTTVSPSTISLTQPTTTPSVSITNINPNSSTKCTFTNRKKSDIVDTTCSDDVTSGQLVISPVTLNNLTSTSANLYGTVSSTTGDNYTARLRWGSTSSTPTTLLALMLPPSSVTFNNLPVTLAPSTTYAARIEVTKTSSTNPVPTVCNGPIKTWTTSDSVVIPTTTSCVTDKNNGLVSITGIGSKNIGATVADLIGKVNVNGTIPSNIRYESSIGYTPFATGSTVSNTPKYIPVGFPTAGKAVDWTATAAHVTGLTVGAFYNPYIKVCKQIGTKSTGSETAQASDSINSVTWTTIGGAEGCCSLQGTQFQTIGT